MTGNEWTECEWLAYTDSYWMLKGTDALLEQTRTRISERKWVLFMAACLKPILHIFGDERSRTFAFALERYADGRLPRNDMDSLGSKTVAPPNPDNLSDMAKEACSEVQLRLSYAWDALVAATPPIQGYDFSEDARNVAFSAAEATMAAESERAAQANFLRDIFGNPFRPVTVDPSWLTWNNGTVVKIAQSIYDDRAFDHLPVLADALEEAGCDNPDFLAHCREPGEHVRGCWVVDLILGKE